MHHESSPHNPHGGPDWAPSKQQLTEWLDTYARAGIDQFMIYGRSGLETEYLSDDWFEACRHCIEYAAELGMGIWIYDEFNWPSGGGKVLAANPDFAARKRLVYRGNPGGDAAESVADGGAFCRIARSTDSILIGARFRFAFTERISRWCDEHGPLSTGHFTNELRIFRRICGWRKLDPMIGQKR